MRPNAVRQEIADACRILASAGLNELHTGHVSRLVDETIYLPEHRHDGGYGLPDVTPEHVLAVDRSGDPVSESDRARAAEPPSEFPIHSMVFEARPGLRSVAHAHPTYATALSAALETVEPATLDATLFEGGIELYDPGPSLVHDEAGGRELAAALGDASAVLIRGHGAVTVGRSVAESVAKLYLLERAAKLQVLAAGVGGVVPFEDQEEVAFLSESAEGFFDEVFTFLSRRHL